MNQEYQGPSPDSDREYIIASYHLLLGLGVRITILEKLPDRLAEIEKNVQVIDKMVGWHTRVLGGAGAVLLAAVAYTLNHLK